MKTLAPLQHMLPSEPLTIQSHSLTNKDASCPFYPSLISKIKNPRSTPYYPFSKRANWKISNHSSNQIQPPVQTTISPRMMLFGTCASCRSALWLRNMRRFHMMPLQQRFRWINQKLRIGLLQLFLRDFSVLRWISCSMLLWWRDVL